AMREAKNLLNRARKRAVLAFLSAVYRVYPASSKFEEYRISDRIREEFACRKVLDVGCGKGNLGKLLRDLELYVGLDLSEIFEQDEGREYIRGIMEKLPIREGKIFDCAYFVNSIFYSSNWMNSLFEAERVSRRLVLIDIDKRYPHIWVLDMLEGRIRAPPHDIKRRLEGKMRVLWEKHGTTFALVLEKSS
ncbi:MAG: methyltransferase domain-containing protein, partial [Fervidicoccaceae archaeon]